MRIFKIIIIGIILISQSCKKKETIPEDIIGKELMVELLFDIHLAEAIYSCRYQLDLSGKNFSEDLYFSVCKKHGVDHELFEKSVFYYGKHPQIYEAIYDEVLNRLNELEDITKNKGKMITP
jgi:hypothetical protein